MGIAGDENHMDRRALLTEREREVLQGEAEDVQDLTQYQSKVRSRVRSRIDRLEEDFDILNDVEPDLADDIHESICGTQESRLEKLEEEVAELREQLGN